METVHAIFEQGVFRPLGPVKLPDLCEVDLEPRPANGATVDTLQVDPELRAEIFYDPTKRADADEWPEENR